MTVRKLKEILAMYDDNDRVIIDSGDIFSANSENEVVVALKCKRSSDKEFPPLLLLQTKQDIDVKSQIEGFFEMCSEENWDEVDSLTELAEYGFTLEDIAYDESRYAWAKQLAETHGIWPEKTTSAI